MNQMIKKYSWLGYPLLVFALIAFSLNFLVGSQSQMWTNLLGKQQEVVKAREEVAKLKTKIEVLKQVNASQVRQDLSQMLVAMPDQKQLNSIAAELRYAAILSGSSLVGYNSTALGNSEFVLSVEYSVPDFVSVQKLMATLETSLPLLKIIDASFSAPRLQMHVVFANSPTQAFTVNLSDELPKYQESYALLKSTLASYQVPVFDETVVTATESGVGVQSSDPFAPLPGSN